MKRTLIIIGCLVLLIGCGFGFSYDDKAKESLDKLIGKLSDGVTYVIEYNSNTGFTYVPATDFAMDSEMPTNNNQLTNGMGFISAVPAQSWESITGKPTITNYTAGTGITINSGVISATANNKRRETYSGVSATTTGLYSVTFATPYTVAPNIQANLINGADNQNIRITSITTTGFTVLVRNRVDVIGLLPTWNNAANVAVDVLINEK